MIGNATVNDLGAAAVGFAKLLADNWTNSGTICSKCEEEMEEIVVVAVTPRRTKEGFFGGVSLWILCEPCQEEMSNKDTMLNSAAPIREELL